MRVSVIRTVAVVLSTVAAGVVVGLVPTGAGPLASAASAASGPRCTIVGTPHDDRLVGTPGRDVICGGGGNDVIVGGGGDDVLIGGAGNDHLQGDGGNDVIEGGAGNDQLAGDAGADQEFGGSGADFETGGGGNDDLSGGVGSDRLEGFAGSDTADGGPGSDVMTGDGGNDVLDGDGGDDDLTGGAGGDDVDGGAGFNVCDAPRSAGDQQIRCVVDTAKPVVDEVTPTPSTVDVSDAAQMIRVEAHVTDDTGVKSVQIGNSAVLVSGTTRDGIWRTTIQVPRYITPGPRDLQVDVRDRVGRWTDQVVSGAYTVEDSVTDQEMPVLQSMTLSTTSVDVRSAAKPITATVHVTDDLAGATDLYLCPAHAFADQTPSFRQSDACVSMDQTAGTSTDSTWKATYIVPKGAPSGTWNFEVWISDAAGNLPDDYWMGPDVLAAEDAAGEPGDRAIPDGGGVFSVVGVAQDVNAPVLTSFELSPATVDTSTGAVQVTADIAGTDVEGITGADLFISGTPDDPMDTVDVANVQSFRLVSGTPQDGVWRATFVVPGGTPDGSYFIQVALEDSAHFESWVSPDSGWTYDDQVLTPDLAPGGTDFVVANS